MIRKVADFSDKNMRRTEAGEQRLEQEDDPTGVILLWRARLAEIHFDRLLACLLIKWQGLLPVADCASAPRRLGVDAVTVAASR
jgi:hypothetical protein